MRKQSIPGLPRGLGTRLTRMLLWQMLFTTTSKIYLSPGPLQYSREYRKFLKNHTFIDATNSIKTTTFLFLECVLWAIHILHHDHSSSSAKGYGTKLSAPGNTLVLLKCFHCVLAITCIWKSIIKLSHQFCEWHHLTNLPIRTHVANNPNSVSL